MAIGAQHKYEYEIDPQSDSAGARVLSLVPAGGKVLELGAGPGSMTRHLSGLRRCDVVAIEVDQTALETLRPFARSVHSLDLNGQDWAQRIAAAEGQFDAVVAADVLEHLYDPWGTFARMTELLGERGSVILSLPHAGHCAVAACLMDGDFEYRDWGLLDRTHIRFFGLKNIQDLHRSQGLAIEDAYFVVRTPEMTEFCHRWQRLPGRVRDVLSSNRFGYVYQVVTRAVPEARAMRSLRLTELPVDMPTAAVVAHWSKIMDGIKASPDSDLTSMIAPDAERGKRARRGFFAGIWNAAAKRRTSAQ